MFPPQNKKCAAGAAHEKRRAPFAATQTFGIPFENAKTESAFLPDGKNTFPNRYTYIMFVSRLYDTMEKTLLQLPNIEKPPQLSCGGCVIDDRCSNPLHRSNQRNHHNCIRRIPRCRNNPQYHTDHGCSRNTVLMMCAAWA